MNMTGHEPALSTVHNYRDGPDGLSWRSISKWSSKRRPRDSRAKSRQASPLSRAQGSIGSRWGGFVGTKREPPRGRLQRGVTSRSVPPVWPQRCWPFGLIAASTGTDRLLPSRQWRRTAGPRPKQVLGYLAASVPLVEARNRDWSGSWRARTGPSGSLGGKPRRHFTKHALRYSPAAKLKQSNPVGADWFQLFGKLRRGAPLDLSALRAR